MKVYDREGNVIEVLDYREKPLNEQIHYARVLEKRSAQFRLTPVLWWSAWAGVIVGWVATLTSFILACVGIATKAYPMAWAFAVLGLVLGVTAFFGTGFLAGYHTKHGMPKKLVEKPKEMYCKSCQKKIEDEQESGREMRAQELLTELASLGVTSVPALAAVPERQDEVDEEEDHVWTPPPDPPFNRGKR